MILALRLRFERISHPSFRIKSLYKLQNILLSNSSIRFSFEGQIIGLPPEQVMLQSIQLASTVVDSVNTMYCTSPFVGGLNNRLSFLFASIEGLRVCLYLLVRIDKFFSKVKSSKGPLENKTKAIYKLKFRDCTAVYVGQTSKYLNSRVSEQRRDCTLGKPTSVIANHCVEFNRNFNFDEPMNKNYSLLFIFRM